MSLSLLGNYKLPSQAWRVSDEGNGSMFDASEQTEAGKTRGREEEDEAERRKRNGVVQFACACTPNTLTVRTRAEERGLKKLPSVKVKWPRKESERRARLKARSNKQQEPRRKPAGQVSKPYRSSVADIGLPACEGCWGRVVLTLLKPVLAE